LIASFQQKNTDPNSKILFDPEQFKKENPEVTIEAFRLAEEKSR